MYKCMPIRDMKDTTAFVKAVQDANGPVSVTRNGSEALVVMTPEYAQMQEQEMARLRLHARIALAEYESATGQTISSDEAVSGLREKYGL